MHTLCATQALGWRVFGDWCCKVMADKEGDRGVNGQFELSFFYSFSHWAVAQRAKSFPPNFGDTPNIKKEPKTVQTCVCVVVRHIINGSIKIKWPTTRSALAGEWRTQVRCKILVQCAARRKKTKLDTKHAKPSWIRWCSSLVDNYLWLRAAITVCIRNL